MLDTSPTQPQAIDELLSFARSACARVEPFPADAALIMSALDAGAMEFERRSEPRVAFRSRSMLWLFNTSAISTPGTVLYTRDLSRNGIGFITRDRLSLGARGVVEMPADGGQTQRIQCTIVRCRELTPSWYEGSAYFCRQPLRTTTA